MKKSIIAIIVIVAIVAAALVLYFTLGQTSETSKTSQSSEAHAADVVIEDFNFIPADFTVKPGAVIKIINLDSTKHTLTSDDDKFDTGLIAKGQTVTLTAPEEVGAYPYHCTPHSWMTGTMTVAE